MEGQKTLLSRTVHGFEYDPIHDEILVSNVLAQAILVFRGGASGEEPPIRVIQGSNTQILGTGPRGNDKLGYDEVNEEIYLPVLDGILVFDRAANGNVPPKRILRGPNTQIKGIGAAAVDNVHNRLIVKGESGGKLLIFDRLASGDTAPLSVIEGPNPGMIGGLPHQHLVYSPKGYIVVGISGGSLGVWHIDDGRYDPPRWTIPIRELGSRIDNGPANTRVEGASSIALNVKDQELLVSSGGGNRLLTFSFPELFE